MNLFTHTLHTGNDMVDLLTGAHRESYFSGSKRRLQLLFARKVVFRGAYLCGDMSRQTKQIFNLYGRYLVQLEQTSVML